MAATSGDSHVAHSLVHMFYCLQPTVTPAILVYSHSSVGKGMPKTMQSSADACRVVEPVRLKRRLGLLHGIAIICGVIIGSGIYISPKGVLQGGNSVGLSLVLWALGGVIGTLGALCFAELGTTFPSAGEKYAYLDKMCGPFVAFLYLWSYLFMFRPVPNAIKCLTFGAYVIKPLFPDCAVPAEAVKLLGIVLCCKKRFILTDSWVLY